MDYDRVLKALRRVAHVFSTPLIHLLKPIKLFAYRTRNFMIRTERNPLGLSTAARGILAELDPALPVSALSRRVR